jgi:hypothetical protein
MRWARRQVPFDIRGRAPLTQEVLAPYVRQIRPLWFLGRLTESQLGS